MTMTSLNDELLHKCPSGMGLEANFSKHDIIQKPVYNLNQLSTGVHFCLLFNQMVKGRFGVHKINFQAKMQIQRLNNLKKLIDGMNEHKFNHSFDITKIAKQSRQQILGVLQWFRKEMEKMGPEPDRQSKPKEKEVKQYKITYKGGNDPKSKEQPQIINKDESALVPITKEFFSQLITVNLIPLTCNEEPIRSYQNIPKVQKDQQNSVQFKQEIKYPSVNFDLRGPLSENNSNIANVNTYINTTINAMEERRERVEKYNPEKNQEFSLTNPFLKKSEEKPISQKRAVRFPLGEALHSQKEDICRSKEDRSLSKKKSCFKSPNNSTKGLDASFKLLQKEQSFGASNLQE